MTDTIVPGETGLFFDAQTSEAVIAGLIQLEQWLPLFDPGVAVANAARFAPERFDHGLRAIVAAAL